MIAFQGQWPWPSLQMAESTWLSLANRSPGLNGRGVALWR